MVNEAKKVKIQTMVKEICKVRKGVGDVMTLK